MADFELSNLENLNEQELQIRFNRGDFVDAEDIKNVTKLLKQNKKEREFIEKCKKASVSAALTAGRYSLAAIIVSILALVVATCALLL